MPTPIRLNKDSYEEKNMALDYSFLLDKIIPIEDNKRKTVIASNKDASLLFDIWSKSEKINEDTFKVNTKQVDNKDIMRLKTQGFITGNTESLHFTSRGKTIIATMALGETNKFAKDADSEKSYTEILASMDKRNKKGYRVPKYAANTSNFLRLG